MDILEYLTQCAVIIFLGITWLLFFGDKSRKKNHYSIPGWNFRYKKICAKYFVDQWKKKCYVEQTDISDGGESVERPRLQEREMGWDRHMFYGSQSDGASLSISISNKKLRYAELDITLTLSDGTVYQLPNHPATIVSNIVDSRSWSAGGLKFTPIIPFQKWRITYNGLLSEGIRRLYSDEDRETHHVRFSFIWTTCSKPYRFPEDCSSDLIAESLARENWKNQEWQNMFQQWEIGGYHQYGSMSGEVYIGESTNPTVLNLRGLRDRMWSPFGSLALHRTVHIIGSAQDGTAFNVRLISYKTGLSQAAFGSVRSPNGFTTPIVSCDLNLAEFGESRNDIPRAHTISFTGLVRHKLVLYLKVSRRTVSMHGLPWEHEIVSTPCEFVVDSVPGVGVVTLGYAYTGPCPMEKLNLVKKLSWAPLSKVEPTERIICASFAEKSARCPQLVGAKGASLALLSSVQTDEYQVPPGFCLTIRSFEKQIKGNPQLQEAINDIIRINENYTEGTLKSACEKATHLFANTPVVSEVETVVLKYLKDLQKLVKEEERLVEDVTYAVRSSGIGEDSEEMSAAGQNDTVLGLRAPRMVLRAVQQCWASLFSFHSVQYRRLHGQPVKSGMGVVVQVVVPAQTAGVMFTRHPNLGDPRVILITANYGLGESVVSGQIEPDTIYLSRDLKDNIKIKNIEIGKKTHQISLNKSTDGEHTEKLSLSHEEATECCVSERDSLCLGRIAVGQEALWGAPRDIEWAIYNSKIYLVQARPITCFDRWSEYELLHEFDTPVMSDEDAFTFANTGEVLPGAISPMTLSVIVKSLNDVIIKTICGQDSSKYHEKDALFMSHNHVGMNLHNTLYSALPASIDMSVRVMEIAVQGHAVLDARLHGVALRRRPPKCTDIFKALSLLMKLLKNKSYAKRAMEVVNNLEINECKYTDSISLLDAIESKFDKLYDLTWCHNQTSSASLFSQIVAMSILVEDKQEFNVDHYADIGLMLSSCTDVVSADVPTGLAQMATAIRQSGKASEFSQASSESAQKWLEENCPGAAEKLKSFIESHAHRNIKEFDLATKTWGLDATSLIQSLQLTANVHPDPAQQAEVHTDTSPKTLVKQLTSPRRNVTRSILRLILPLCHRAVSSRETTKSMFILAIHKLRLAYVRLGRLLVRDWLLPDHELVFYFTLDELKNYMRTRDPISVTKATQRRRFYAKWNCLKFAENHEGPIRPLEEAYLGLAVGGASGNSLVGTPVCAGNVVARACVVRDLSEISQLRSGDILITHSTDIGWSPYFPLLGGVVTELGGLISHGAVIAREYGLPCIVGATGATTAFHTGDLVLLAGATGTLQHIDSPTTPTTSPTATTPTTSITPMTSNTPTLTNNSP